MRIFLTNVLLDNHSHFNCTFNVKLVRTAVSDFDLLTFHCLLMLIIILFRVNISYQYQAKKVVRLSI